MRPGLVFEPPLVANFRTSTVLPGTLHVNKSAKYYPVIFRAPAKRSASMEARFCRDGYRPAAPLVVDMSRTDGVASTGMSMPIFGGKP